MDQTDQIGQIGQIERATGAPGQAAPRFRVFAGALTPSRSVGRVSRRAMLRVGAIAGLTALGACTHPNARGPDPMPTATTPPTAPPVPTKPPPTPTALAASERAPTPVPSPLTPPASASRPVPSPSSSTLKPGYLRAQGSRLVDAKGDEAILTGVNWFGFETDASAPHGLWARNWGEMLDLVARLGYNVIRLPYANQVLDPNCRPGSLNYSVNPDLQGLNALQLMDKLVEGAGQRGIKVILDRHRPTPAGQSNLWYVDAVPEEQWIADWVFLARRYRGNDAVVGVDLHNEPHGEATWGAGDPKTDWRLAAERAGNAILEANPDLLIIVEGIERYEDDWYWWGGNLQGVARSPIKLGFPDKLVYSAHDYGPGVYNQKWFQDRTFPDNLPAVWDTHWGYVVRQDIAPVLVGEFGGRSVGSDAEGIWQRALVAYLKEHRISYTYWCLNPNSGDTGGILADDWQTVNQAKQDLLASYQAPKLPVANASVVDLSLAIPARQPRR